MVISASTILKLNSLFKGTIPMSLQYLRWFTTGWHISQSNRTLLLKWVHSSVYIIQWSTIVINSRFCNQLSCLRELLEWSIWTSSWFIIHLVREWIPDSTCNILFFVSTLLMLVCISFQLWKLACFFQVRFNSSICFLHNCYASSGRFVTKESNLSVIESSRPLTVVLQLFRTALPFFVLFLVIIHGAENKIMLHLIFYRIK